MKKIALSFIASLAVASGALAGHAVVETSGKDYKGPPPPIPCFRDTELKLDIFGSYSWFSNDGTADQDGWGGGVGLNYFFTRYIGLGVDGNVFDAGVHGLWVVSGSLIARFPIEGGGICLAPYVLGGAGVATDGSVENTWHAGGGLEWRAVPEKLGVYAEGRYIWANDHGDHAQVRLGVRFVF